jgi:hypothetical protein
MKSIKVNYKVKEGNFTGKLIKVGDSKGFTVPKTTLEVMGAELGDKFIVSIQMVKKK